MSWPGEDQHTETVEGAAAYEAWRQAMTGEDFDPDEEDPWL